jgi:hypothetical protein
MSMGTEDQIYVSPRAGSESIADMLGIASQLAGREEIGSIQVVSDRRPSYDELVRFRRWADARALELTVSASGVSFHPRHARAPALPDKEPFHQWFAVLVRRVSAVRHWAWMHGQTWCARFGAMNEGTR